ncbi:MAG: hypothetical protein KF779_14160 [Hyphomonadaceae bacterium]|nr:hypothetical protein [Hyphomonadaceae bacterium]
MKVLLGATAAILLMATPALAQTTPAALPAQCNFTPPPTIPDGATATNSAMSQAREALGAWRTTRETELAACTAQAQALQAQAQAAAAAHNAGLAETNATIQHFQAENEAYTARGASSRRERGSTLTRPDH